MRIVGGKFKGRPLATPTTHAIRPTLDRTRESLFNILANKQENFFSNKRVLDLFAGTGALGLEALSRGAEAAVFVENSVEGRGLIQKNIEAFGLQGTARILRRDATKLGTIGTMIPFDIIFADPPYGHGFGEAAFLAAIQGGFCKADALFILEEKQDCVISLPKNFQQCDERHYGGTIIRLYNYLEN